MLRTHEDNLSHASFFRAKGSFLTPKRLLAVGLMGLLIGWAYGMAHGRISTAPAAPSLVDGTVLMPESERPLDLCVIGVGASRDPFYFLPSLEKNSAMTPARFREIHEQLYWLNFEISHGRILTALPPTTQIYVALPDARKVKEADGREGKYFQDYLRSRCGWTEGEIQNRIHFFRVPVPLVWAQDIGKILGRDAEGRWVINRGPNDQETYREAIVDLCKAYPDKFSYRDLPPGVSAEGGDEDLVRAPDGRLAFLVGRHRARKYLEFSEGRSLEGQVLPPVDLLQAQTLFSSAFHEVPVVFMPHAALENPALGNNELFHLDMSVAILSSPSGPRAFVPSYIDQPVDRVSGKPLDPAFVKSLQAEYDLMASELSSLGYPVDRLTITDHPVRSPANLVRFMDPTSGRCTVLLAKYPYHFSQGGTPNAQEKFMASLGVLNEKAEVWRKNPAESGFRDLRHSIQSVWNTMDQAAVEPNPYFEANEALFKKAGFEVVPVPDYAWGAGGLHCQLLH